MTEARIGQEGRSTNGERITDLEIYASKINDKVRDLLRRVERLERPATLSLGPDGMSLDLGDQEIETPKHRLTKAPEKGTAEWALEQMKQGKTVAGKGWMSRYRMYDDEVVRSALGGEWGPELFLRRYSDVFDFVICEEPAQPDNYGTWQWVCETAKGGDVFTCQGNGKTFRVRDRGDGEIGFYQELDTMGAGPVNASDFLRNDWRKVE